MKNRVAAVLLLAALAAPASVLAATWTNVSLVDQNCSKKVKDDPDSHPRACALECAASGFGILTAEGEFLKFDADGSKQALAALRASDREDHLRVDVTGEVENGVLRVETLTLRAE